MTIRCISAMTFAFLGTFSAANAYTLSCQMTDMRTAGGWVPSAVVLRVADDGSRVDIVGPKALVAGLDSNEGELITENDSRLRASIRTIQRSVTGQRADMLYTVTWIKKNNRASIVAKPLGYTNQFRAAGACTKS